MVFDMTKENIVTVCFNPAVDKTIVLKQLILGAHQTSEQVFRTQGGKGVNVSRTLNAMGLANTTTGFLGSENRYEFDDFLRHPMIDDRFVMLEGRTRENTTIVDVTARVDTHIRDKGLTVNLEGLAELEQIFNEVPPDSLIVFSGSLAPGIELEVFGSMLKKCSSYGLKVVVDISGDALKIASSEKLFLIKPNIEELSQYAGRSLTTQSELIDVAKQDCSKVENVLISMGSQGAILVGQSKIIKVCCPSCNKKTINTVGCGDVLLGSFVGMLSQAENFEKCLKRAVANASACAFHPVPAMFDKKLAGEFYKNTDVEIIENLI